jgi:hypothetical protein
MVRYGPAEWKALNRQGVSGSLGMAWRGQSGSARVSWRGSRHAFQQLSSPFQPRREDSRMGVEVDGSVEGTMVVRLSAGVSWNDSRLTAYDFRSGRAAVVVSAPWGHSSIQAYAALAHQTYLNPGAEGERVAPSDQDMGSVLALQLTRPLHGDRSLTLRGEWSRSETGFRNDFHQRFATSVHLSFRRPGSGRGASAGPRQTRFETSTRLGQTP